MLAVSAQSNCPALVTAHEQDPDRIEAKSHALGLVLGADGARAQCLVHAQEYVTDRHFNHASLSCRELGGAGQYDEKCADQISSART
jgi:hypothetical protein